MPPQRWPNDVRRGWAGLAGAAALAAVVWLAALPYLARQSAIHGFIERNKSLGIDPSAKFYTELPAMPALVDRVETIKRTHEAAFWRSSMRVAPLRSALGHSNNNDPPAR
jgi:hypothetical protein